MVSMAIHQIDKNDLKVGTQIEAAEHPSLGQRTARRIAADHLAKNPKAYATGKKSSGCGGEQEHILILNQNIRVKTTKPKKKLPPPPQAPTWQTWGRELL